MTSILTCWSSEGQCQGVDFASTQNQNIDLSDLPHPKLGIRISPGKVKAAGVILTTLTTES